MTGADALARWKLVTQAAVQRWTRASDDTPSAPTDRASVDLERWRQSLPVAAPVLRSIQPSPMGVVR